MINPISNYRQKHNFTSLDGIQRPSVGHKVEMGNVIMHLVNQFITYAGDTPAGEIQWAAEMLFCVLGIFSELNVPPDKALEVIAQYHLDHPTPQPVWYLKERPYFILQGIENLMNEHHHDQEHCFQHLCDFVYDWTHSESFDEKDVTQTIIPIHLVLRELSAHMGLRQKQIKGLLLAIFMEKRIGGSFDFSLSVRSELTLTQDIKIGHYVKIDETFYISGIIINPKEIL